MYQKREKIKDILLMMPALLVLILIEFVPLVYGVILSVTNVSLNRPDVKTAFVGLKHYIYILTRDGFLNSLIITLKIAVVCITVEFLFGFMLAFILDKQRKSNGTGKIMGFVRGILFTPYMVMPVIVGKIWFYMMDTNFGLVTYILSLLGVVPTNFFGKASTVLQAIMVIEIWQCTPMVMLLLAAGLKSIDGTYYEAGEIDGANVWQRIRYITLPLMRPIISVTLCIRIMDILRIYDTVFATSKGGPGNSSEVMSLFVYKTAFSGGQTSRGAAGAMIIAFIVLVISFINLRFFSADNSADSTQ